MSVKKMGSKLAQGVRKVKAQQAKTPAIAEKSDAQSAAKPATASAAKPATKVAAIKPAASSTNSTSMLHPDRVWPD